ncbi:N-6 DNA methylase [Pseudoalteromonas sp. YIC-827]|uniref:site-specific DNA-methyltransferase (adenine-specific) n=1 Tax=Pseudoalteromonas qingdaonensis TaxID=3131913 RepID=A0ABU9MVJ7_9GAMM
MKQQIFYSVVDFFRKSSGLDIRDTLFISQALFLWLKLTDEEQLDEDESFQGSENISEHFEKFIHIFYDGYKYATRRPLKLDDESLNALVEKIKGALDKGLITYFEVVEIAFQMSLNEGRFEINAPNELVELGCGLIDGEVRDVYCPFSASYRFAEALGLEGKECYLEVNNVFDHAWIKISYELKDLKHYRELLASDPVTSPVLIDNSGLRQFSHTIALPPFGVKYPKDVATSDMFGRFPEKSLMGEVLQLRHMLAQTSEQIVTFVASGFLSRTAAGEKQFKQDMIKQGLLHAVIALPEKLFNNTAIPVNALIFDKRKKAESVLFIDASGEHFIKKEGKRNVLNNISEIISLYHGDEDAFIEYNNPCGLLDLAVHASPEEIIKNDFNLLPSRYVLSHEQKELNRFLANNETIALADIAELIGPQAIKDEMDGEAIFYEYGLSNLNDIGEFVGEGKTVTTNSQISRAENQILQENDILIVNKGSVGKVAFVEQVPAENAMPSQAFTIVRVNRRLSDIEPVALFQYLLSPMGQLQLESMATGVTVTMIGTKDLKNMRIPVFSQQQTEEARQRRNKVKQLHNQLFEIEQEIKQLNHKNWVN